MVASEFVQHDVDTTAVGDPIGLVSTVNQVAFPTWQPECCAELLASLGHPAVTGRVSTGDWFAVKGQRAEWIRGTFSPLLTEMEGGAIAQVCLRNGVRFVSVKSVSDHLFSDSQAEEYFDFGQALEALGIPGTNLEQPNDILATEYCKAILAQRSPMVPFPIRREGCYHDRTPDQENPSATAVRRLMLEGGAWGSFVPEPARAIFENAPLHSLAAGERAVLARLRTMADEEFEALPFGGEGLWRKFMHASRREATLEDILISVKSKRYTRTRLDRMMMCAYLGITAEILAAPAPYVRVLAFNKKGRAILSAVKKSGVFRNAGETVPHPYQSLEQRWGDLYGLFALGQPEAPGAEQRRRIVFASD